MTVKMAATGTRVGRETTSLFICIKKNNNIIGHIQAREKVQLFSGINHCNCVFWEK